MPSEMTFDGLAKQLEAVQVSAQRAKDAYLAQLSAACVSAGVRDWSTEVFDLGRSIDFGIQNAMSTGHPDTISTMLGCRRFKSASDFKRGKFASKEAAKQELGIVNGEWRRFGLTVYWTDEDGDFDLIVRFTKKMQ